MALTILIGPFLAGMALGAAYLAALWLTVRRLPRVQNPALWLIAGAALRLAILLPALLWIMDSQWQRLLACVLGFVLVRVAILAWFRTAGHDRPVQR